MAKFANDLVMDAALDFVRLNAERLVVCAGQPANYAAVAGAALADVAIDDTDFTLANGDTSGRKSTLAQQANIPIDTSGTADHVVVVDDTNSRILIITTCTSQALTAGGTVTVPAFDEEIADPS